MKSDLVTKWNLNNPRPLISTPRSELWRVTTATGEEAVLKFGALGTESLQAWQGHGAVRLLRADAHAQLLEYIDGPMLRTWVANGDDDGATRILAQVASRLHIRGEATPMERHFKSLLSRRDDPRFREHARMAADLLTSQREACLLHGDIHHENILFSSNRGWLAIDPQSLKGEREYDFANTFYNPLGFAEFAMKPETIRRRRDILLQELDLNRDRLRRYAFVHGGLSAAWSLEDGRHWEETLKMSHLVFAHLADA